MGWVIVGALKPEEELGLALVAGWASQATQKEWYYRAC